MPKWSKDYEIRKNKSRDYMSLHSFFENPFFFFFYRKRHVKNLLQRFKIARYKFLINNDFLKDK